MKKYKLLKDIPVYFHICPKGNILVKQDDKYYQFKDFNSNLSEEVVENNPEFFEEVTRWKPDKEELYYYINSEGEIDFIDWCDENGDTQSYEFGNCFKTREQAEHARDEIKKLLLNLHENEM
jgi:hypothetical protein